MNKIITKSAGIVAAASVILVPFITRAVDLGATWGATIGLGSADLESSIASIISIVLGFLGMIAVIIILLGGFKWMTSAGNEDKIGEAKKLITNGVIGLVIILAAYALTTFVIGVLTNATGA